jgi:hypothetical protein
MEAITHKRLNGIRIEELSWFSCEALLDLCIRISIYRSINTLIYAGKLGGGDGKHFFNISTLASCCSEQGGKNMEIMVFHLFLLSNVMEKLGYKLSATQFDFKAEHDLLEFAFYINIPSRYENVLGQ